MTKFIISAAVIVALAINLFTFHRRLRAGNHSSANRNARNGHGRIIWHHQRFVCNVRV
jgi:hypothetical protein